MLPWIKKLLRHQYQYTMKSHAIFQYGILCISWVLFLTHQERRMRTLLHGSCILDTMMQNHLVTSKCQLFFHVHDLVTQIPYAGWDKESSTFNLHCCQHSEKNQSETKTCLSFERGFLCFVKFSLFRRWVHKVTQRCAKQQTQLPHMGPYIASNVQQELVNPKQYTLLYIAVYCLGFTSSSPSLAETSANQERRGFILKLLKVEPEFSY